MSARGEDEFYVGYLPAMPPRLARWTRAMVATLILGFAFLAGFWIAAQRPFGPGVFEFGQVRHFEGVVSLEPFPSLLVERPGIAGAWPGFSRYLLTGPGKHGADALVAGLDGRAVSLEGTLVYRDGHTLIKLEDRRPAELPADGRDHHGVPALALRPRALGPVRLQGEIVDPQCFLGIMKPGFGIPHRSCAIRCLAGGVPPMLHGVDAMGQWRDYLLLGPHGERITRRLLPFVAERIQVEGQGFAYGELLALHVQSLQALP